MANEPAEAPHGGIHGGAIIVNEEFESMFISEQRGYVFMFDISYCS